MDKVPEILSVVDGSIYFKILLPCLLIGLVWLLTRIRFKKGKDGIRSWKNGWYFYSQKEENSRVNDKFYKLLSTVENGMKQNREDIKDFKNAYDKGHQELLDKHALTHKEILQLQITNEQLPKYARLQAYDEYKQCGYNSWINKYAKDELFGGEVDNGN